MKNKMSERGSIFVLAIFLITCILAVLALFIDGGIGYIGRQQYDGAATQAALGALETYVNSDNPALDGDPPALNEYKLNLARTRAEELFAAAVGTNSMSRSMVSSGAHVLKFPWEPSGGENGIIRHGVWHFAEPTGAGAYTGCGTGASFKPCFQPLDDKALPGNALRIESRLAGGSVLKTFFAKTGLVQIPETSVATQKGAALIPRMLFFLPDVSLSSVQYSHLSKSHNHGGPDYSGYYAFPLKTGEDCSGGLDPAKVVPGLQAVFAELDTNHKNRPGGENSPAFADRFYKSDYECIEVDSGFADCDYARFYVDTFTHRLPQPLTSILAGMHTSLEKLRLRGTLSDRVGMLAFDSGPPLTCRGSLKSTGTPPVQSLGLLNIKTSDDYDKLLDTTDLTLPRTSPERVDRLLFPRFSNSVGDVLKTDIGLALRKSEQVIQSTYSVNESTAAQLDIIVYSDGESNCYRTSHLNSTGETCTAAAYQSGSDPITGEPRCCKKTNSIGFIDGTPKPVIWSIDEILEQFDEPTDELIQRRVALNMVLFANSVHEVVRSKGSGGGCMTNAEISAAKLPLTDWGGATNDGWAEDPTEPGSVRYWYVNKLWQAVEQSGGFWWVVRPPCSTPTDSKAAGGIPHNYGADITAACNDLNVANAPVNLNAFPAFECQTCTTVSRDADKNGTPDTVGTKCPYTTGDPEICKYIDARGRLLCDIQNRSETEQIIDFINEMTKVNPFKPVEVSS